MDPKPIKETELLEQLRRSSLQMAEGSGGGNADFEGRDLYGLKFAELLKKAGKKLEPYLGGANFRGAKLCYADLSGFDLEDADFTGADLYGAKLKKTSLNGAVFRDASLCEADISGATAYDVEVEGADLTQLKRTGAKGDSRLTKSTSSGGKAKLKKAAIASAESAAETCELEELDVSDPDGLDEAADDLWHHMGVPDLEAEFGEDDDLADAIEEQGAAFRKAAVAVLKARLRKGAAPALEPAVMSVRPKGTRKPTKKPRGSPPGGKRKPARAAR